MPLQAKVLSGGRSFKSLVSPVISVTIHSDIQRALGFPNIQYVGETKGPLNIRMNGHRDDWRHKRFERSPTAEHFCLQGHDFLSHASVCCLESNSEWKDNARKSRESYWIRRLNTLNPSGINKGD